MDEPITHKTRDLEWVEHFIQETTKIRDANKEQAWTKHIQELSSSTITRVHGEFEFQLMDVLIRLKGLSDECTEGELNKAINDISDYVFITLTIIKVTSGYKFQTAAYRTDFS